MKAGTLIKDYLTFNQKEQRGVIVLLTLYFCLVFMTLFFPLFFSDKPVDFTGFEKEITAFEKDLTRLESLDLQAKQKKYGNYNFVKSNGVYDTNNKFQKGPKEILIIELNAADTFELQRLHGIGSSFARRIVKYRERLGGFLDKSQVREVWGMDTARYNKISANLTVNPDSVHKINLNTVTLKELLFHPYFPFEITKAIMIYRKEHKKFNKLDELKSIPGIRDSTYKKIINYLLIDNN
jgi:competence ComEA-like helix-hairpin-helix protein